MKNILFISYHFPPQGGAGVQRSLKFSKYLPEFGINPIVITSPGKSYDRWTPKDNTLLADLPDGVDVHRYEWPRAGLQPEKRQVLMDQIISSCQELHSEHQFEAIFVTMSPFEDAEMASKLSNLLSIPWIADLRDPWALDEFQIYRTFLDRKKAYKRMAGAFPDTSLIIMNTPTSEALVKEHFPEIAARTKISHITNGYDAEDFSRDITDKGNTFTIVHTGFLHTKAGLDQIRKRWRYNLMGKMQPGVEILSRSHYYLIKALENLVVKQPELKNKIRLVLAGSLNETDQKVVAESAVAEMVDMPGYLDHTQSVATIRAANLLFMPLHDLAKGQKASIVPGKTYEYLATGNPILGAVPEGDAKDFIANSGIGFTCEPADVNAMEKVISALVQDKDNATNSVNFNHSFVSQFERKNLSERLAELIQSVIEK